MAAAEYRVRPSPDIGGSMAVPGDKSISHRALILGSIAEGATEVSGFLESEDCRATLAAMREMGVAIERLAPAQLQLHGVGRDGLTAPARALDMGNAGTAMRLSMGLLAGQRFDSILTGDASLSRRPMERAAAPLRAMGAHIDTVDGHAPVTVHGSARLEGRDHALAVPSAQVKSAVLIAGLYAEGETRVREPAVTRDHTERMLRRFGADVEATAQGVSIRGHQRLQGCRLTVPGDLSSAAFFLVAGALGASDGLRIEGVGVNPTRDGVLTILKAMGARLTVHPRPPAGEEPIADLEIRKSELKGIAIPRALVPLSIDELPVLMIAAACARGRTVLKGAEELRIKESDRIAAMAEGLTRLGVSCETTPDGIVIEGGTMQGGVIDSHGDHRIAMAFAIAGVAAAEEIRILDVGNVATSFPDFPAAAARAGLSVHSP